MIANCGAMGIDWRLLTLSDYLEALEAANEMNSPDGGKVDREANADKLAAVMKARMID